MKTLPHNEPRLPLQPLLDHLNVTLDELARECRVSATTARAANATGLTAAQARSWCHHAGVDFDDVWPTSTPTADTRPAPLKAVPTVSKPAVASGPFEWVDELPPPAKKRVRGRTSWATVLDPLRTQPGRWARVVTNIDTEKKAKQRRWSMRNVLGAGFQVEWRPNPDGTFDVYARYVGADT